MTRAEVLSAVDGSYGLATEIARRLGCTVHAVNAVLDEGYEDVSAALEAEGDRQEDIIVRGIIDDAKAGDAKARELFLRTLARRHSSDRSRGGAQQLTVRFSMPEPESVTPESKAGAIGRWAREAEEFRLGQEAEARESADSLLLGLSRPRGLPEGGE